MPRERGVSIENNFSRGLITEATGLNFPQNACTDALNCVFDERGPVTRRSPIDFENGYEDKEITKTDSVVTSYKWKNVSGDGAVTLQVVQVGETLYFYRYISGAISPGALSTTVDLTDFEPASAPSPALNECEFSSGLGYLFVTHPTLEPFYVTFDTSTNTADSFEIDVLVRDYLGLPDDQDVDERPNSLDATNEYNIKNAGWYDDAKITDFETAVGDFPSYADVWWIYRDVTGALDFSLYTEIDRGTTLAPRGHYILNAFNQDRATASGVGGATATTTSYFRPSVSAFFAGRVFYAGVSYAGWESKILFSQVIEDISQVGNCYSRNDPTSETAFDPIDSDGGYFSIPEAGTIHNLASFGKYLLIFAANGVWALTGSDGLGFTATNLRVEQIGLVSTISAKSFIDARGLPMWWNADGIYTVTQNAQGNLDVKSVTDNNIRSFFADIPLQSKLFARGVFDPNENIAYWIYRAEEASDTESTYEFDSVLTFNALSQSFSPWLVDVTDVSIHDIFLVGDIRSVAAESEVLDNDLDTVTDNSLADVTIIETASSLDTPEIKFLVSHEDSGTQFTMAGLNNARADYQDWGAVTAADYESYFITGYRLRTQGVRHFQSNYLFLFLNVTDEDNTCSVSSRWDFFSSDVGRWSTPQTVSASTGDQTIVRRKLLMRGQGVSVQYKFEASSGEGFNIEGWSIFDTANTTV